MPRRRLAHLGGAPGHPAALLELHHVVLPDLTAAQRHREHITDPPDALPGVRRAQVVVAIPARLLSRIRDQLEDPLGPGRDLTARNDDTPFLLLGCHVPIQAPPARADLVATPSPTYGPAQARPDAGSYPAEGNQSRGTRRGWPEYAPVAHHPPGASYIRMKDSG